MNIFDDDGDDINADNLFEGIGTKSSKKNTLFD